MKAMVEPAGQHLHSCARLLVERPEADIKAMQIILEGPHYFGEEGLRLRIPGVEIVIKETPRRPHESVQDMSWRFYDSLFKPCVALRVNIFYTTVSGYSRECLEGLLGGMQVCSSFCHTVGAYQNGDALALRKG